MLALFVGEIMNKEDSLLDIIFDYLYSPKYKTLTNKELLSIVDDELKDSESYYCKFYLFRTVLEETFRYKVPKGRGLLVMELLSKFRPKLYFVYRLKSNGSIIYM